MIYLLDVNVLIALGYATHVHHSLAEWWLTERKREHGAELQLVTCAITELGFVRIAGGQASLAESVSCARDDLRRLKAKEKMRLVGDDLGTERLPRWVTQPKQTTDGHLVALSAKHNARFATLDSGVPGAELISDAANPPWVVRDVITAHGLAAWH